MGGEAFRQLDPGRPLSAPLDRGGDYGRLSQTDIRYRRPHQGALRFRELHQHPTDGEALVRGPPRTEPEHFAEVCLLALVGVPPGILQLTPVGARMNFPGELTCQNPVRLHAEAELGPDQMNGAHSITAREIIQEARHGDVRIEVWREPAGVTPHDRRS